MFGTAERALQPKRALKKREWWFTLEPNPVQEKKIWEAKIEEQWWICESNGKGDFHMIKTDRSHGRGIDEKGLFNWLAGFGIDRDMVVKYAKGGDWKELKWIRP